MMVAQLLWQHVLSIEISFFYEMDGFGLIWHIMAALLHVSTTGGLHHPAGRGTLSKRSAKSRPAAQLDLRPGSESRTGASTLIAAESVDRGGLVGEVG
jgi:hypothetical protein